MQTKLNLSEKQKLFELDRKQEVAEKEPVSDIRAQVYSLFSTEENIYQKSSNTEHKETLLTTVLILYMTSAAFTDQERKKKERKSEEETGSDRHVTHEHTRSYRAAPQLL